MKRALFALIGLAAVALAPGVFAADLRIGGTHVFVPAPPLFLPPPLLLPHVTFEVHRAYSPYYEHSYYSRPYYSRPYYYHDRHSYDYGYRRYHGWDRGNGYRDDGHRDSRDYGRDNGRDYGHSRDYGHDRGRH